MLSVTVADRPEELLEELVAVLSVPASDPFTPEWVAVPNFGMRVWLQQQLAARLGAGTLGDGIAANLELPFPGSLRWTILRAHAAGDGRDAAPDPWQVDRLVWPVLEVMADPPTGLDRRLTDTAPGVPPAARAGPVADLFDRYGVHRPAMLAEWVAGRDVDGVGEPLAPERCWQPQLYRAVRSRILAAGGPPPPAERLAEALDRLRAGDLRLDGPRPAPWLPARLAVFGPSVLPPELVDVLTATAVRRDVRMLLLSPSATASVAEATRSASRVGSGPLLRSDPLASPVVRHPVLRSWGSRQLESAQLLGVAGIVPVPATPVDNSTAPGLLGRLQSDLRADRTDGPPHGRSGADTSVQVIAAPGPARQVEALRDALLALLRDEEDLTEDDIAVVCPQLERWAPVIGAVWGAPARPGEQPADGAVPALRYSLVDRSARGLNPLADGMARVLEVVAGRFDVGAVGDLLRVPAVRERFGLGAEELELFSIWVDQACVRWGLDGPQRSAWGIPAEHHANSWAAGVDQLLMGAALGDPLRDVVPGELPPPGAGDLLGVGSVWPMPLDSGDLAAAGRLATAVRHLARAHEVLLGGGDRPVETWAATLSEVADLMVAAPRFEEWQRSRWDALVDALVDASRSADGGASPAPLGLADLRRLLTPALEGQRARADLGVGSVVVARPSLLASVPRPVVCILGLDDDALPAARPGGDDLLAATPRVGDREPRSEARAELLAAVTAARRHLVVTCTSRSVATNEKVPESTVLDEFLTTIALTCDLDADAVRTPSPGVVLTLPRQAFDPSNFRSGEGTEPFSFDPSALAGAVALRDRPPGTAETGSLMDTRLDPVPDPDTGIDLAALLEFYRHPVRAFFRRRLGLAVPESSGSGAWDLPTDLSGLDRYAIGQRLVDLGPELEAPAAVVPDEHGRYGDPVVDRWLAAERARGLLPPPVVERSLLADLGAEAAGLLTLADDLDVRRSADAVHQVRLELPSGGLLVGAVTGCVPSPRPGPVEVCFSRAKPHRVVRAAIRLLALTAEWPDEPWRGVVIQRPGTSSAKRPVTWVRTVAGDSPAERRAVALRALDTLVAQYRDGSCIHLPLFDRTSERVHAGSGASTAWGSPDYEHYSHERIDPYHLRAFGGVSFDELAELDVAGTTVAREAHRLWGTLAEALSDPEARS